MTTATTTTTTTNAPATSTINTNALVGRQLEWAVNSPALLQSHAEHNGSIIRTRFPPEPNGYLHIGHAKSMNMNFRLAFEKLGVEEANRRTIFRYDDTNPEAESAEYIDSLERDVRWMGWKPERVTYSSEVFQQLYEFAIVLIQKELAYVCDFDKATVERQRELAKRRAQARGKGLDPDTSVPLDPELIPGKNRLRSVNENLALFDKMKKGYFKEGEYTLRLKMDFDSSNPNMYDLMAYRIKYVPHPHIGAEWCIYPTYDYTHSICDSLEHIDYSICTLEFENRREPYYWMLWALDLFRPKVYEMSRLNLQYTILSKRRLLKLVDNGYMRGWNDCRMPTISGFRRKGYTPSIINEFCSSVGATRANNVVEIEKFNAVARAQLGEKARRCMAAIDPIKIKVVELVGFTESENDSIFEVKNSPTNDAFGSHMIKFTRDYFYIDRDDFRLDNMGGNYYGLTPNQHVGIKYVGANVHVIKLKYDDKDSKRLSEIEVKLDLSEGRKKPKSHISWCPSDSIPCEVRVYGNLFLVPEPTEKWEEELNPNSEVVYSSALVDPSVMEIVDKCPYHESSGKILEDLSGCMERHFQFERKGFFVIDIEATRDKLVFNRIVSLREDVPSKPSTQKSAKEIEKLDARKALQAKQIALKQARLKISPENLFKEAEEYKGLYSTFGEDGIPTHDATGEKLSKSAIKSLKKDQAKHVKALKVKAMKEASG